MASGNGHRPPASITSPLPAIQAEFEALVERNKAGLASLQREGINLDPLSLVHARIDHLIDQISMFAGPDGPRWALYTRLEFERRIAENLENARKEGTKANLAMGGKFTPSMIRDLARQSGTFGGLY
jgi:hypothetical protein